MPLRLGFGLSFGRPFTGSAGPSIQITATTIADNASVGDPLGTLSVSNGSGSYTYAITGGTLAASFAIDGAAVEVAGALTASTGTLEIEADNGVDPVVTRTITVTITAAASGETASIYWFLPTWRAA